MMMKTLHTFLLLFAFVLAKAQTPTIMFDDVTKTYGDAPFFLTTNVYSSTPKGFSISNDSIASVSPDGYVVIRRAGTATITVSQIAFGGNPGYTYSSTLTVYKANASFVNITSSNKIGTTHSMDLVATSNPAGAKFKWWIQTQNNTNATIVGSKLYAGDHVGTLTIAAEIQADENFALNATSSTFLQEIEVLASSGDSAINVDDTHRTFGDEPFYLNANSISNGAFSYSIANDSIASVDSVGLITIKKVGITTITIQQEAINIFPAYTKKVKLTIDKAFGYPVSISSKSILAANDSMELKAETYPSNAKLKWTITQQNGTDSKIIGSKLFAGSQVGTVEIKAFVVEDNNIFTDTLTNSYNFSINIDPGSGTPIIHSSSIQKTFGDEPFVFEANSVSNAPFKYKIKSGNAATIDSVTGLVTLLSHGKVAIESSLSAIGSFSAAAKVDTLYINKPYLADLVIDAPEIVLINDSLSLSANSTPTAQKVTWSILSQNGTNAYFVGNKFYSGADTGYVEIVAELEKEGFEKTPITKTITVSRYLTPTISPNLIYMVYRDTTFNINASSVSKGLFTYTIENDSIANIDSSGLITLKKPGSTTITINQAADGNYTSASTAVLLNIDTPHTLYAYDITINYGDINFMYLNFNTVSPGKLSYTVSNDSIISVNELGGVTIKKAGVATIKVSQAASEPYVAVSKTVTFTVNKTKAKVYSLAIISNNSGIINDSISLTATTYTAGAKVKWLIAKQTGTSATIKGNTLYTGANAGNLDVVAEVVPDDNYEIYTVSSTIASSLTAKQTITVYTSKSPEIVYENRNVTYDSWDFYMHATSNSNGNFTYAIDSGTVASINTAGAVHILGLGTVKIKATQAASPPFSASSKTAYLTITKLNAYINNTTFINRVILNDTLPLTATYYPSNSTLKWEIESQNGTEATISNSKLYAGSKVGTLVLVVRQLISDTNFIAPLPVKMTVSVDAASKPTLYFNDDFRAFNATPFRIGAYSNSTGTITYSIDTDTSISITSDGLVTVKKMGKTKVFLYQAASKLYTSIADTAIITIGKAKVYSISITSPNKVNINDSIALIGTTNPVGAKLKWKINYGDSTGSVIKDSKLYAGSKIGILNITAEVVADEFFEAYVGSSTNSAINGTQRINMNSTSGTPTIYFPNSYRDYIGGNVSSFAINPATSNSSGAFTYSISDEPSASINSSGVIVFKNLDSLRKASMSNQNYQIVLTVTAHQEASPPFEAAFKTAYFYIYTAIITGNEESNSSFSKPIAYPNPAKDILQIKSGKGASCEATISLYNMNGIEQNTTSTQNGDDYQIDISELSSGVYSLKMTYCNEVFTQKVVKQ